MIHWVMSCLVDSVFLDRGAGPRIYVWTVKQVKYASCLIIPN